MTAFWTNDTHWTDDDRKSFRTNHPALITPYGSIKIPLVIEKTKHFATNSEGKKIASDVLQVTTPTNFATPAKKLLDGVILKLKTFSEFVPAGLRRENQDLYYSLLREQAKWMNRHRNIQIHAVPATEASTVIKLLSTNKSIHRIYVDRQSNRLHVSTSVDKFTSIREWIVNKLKQAQFPFSPTVNYPHSSKTTASPTRSTYSTLFQASVTKTQQSDDSFDSTIKTTKSNAWNRTRAIPVTIDFSADAEAFPPLPPVTKTVSDQPTITSKTTFADDDTIRTAVASAVQELTAAYDKKLEEMNAKLAVLEKTLINFGSIETKLDQLLLRFTPTDDTNTTPPRRAKRQDQKPTPIIARPSPDDSMEMTLDSLPDDNDLSATSSPIALEGRGS
jgi:hypothetical protein